MLRLLYHVLVASIATLFLRPTRVSAQFPPGSPEAVVASALQADSVHDGWRLLGLLHPLALLDFRSGRVEALNSRYFGDFPGIDSCVMRLQALYTQTQLDSVYRVPSLDSLARTQPESLYVRAQAYLARFSLPARPDSLRPTSQIHGSLAVNDSLAFVLVHEHYAVRPFPRWPEDRAEVYTVRRYRGQWRALLDGELANVGAFGVMGDGCRRH